MLAAAQLSRAVERRADTRPVLSVLRESVSLEQDAGVVLFIHSPDPCASDTLKMNLAGIIVVRHRNDSIRSGFELVFPKELAKFENAETRRTPQPQSAQAE